jgi:hypothetical protein
MDFEFGLKILMEMSPAQSPFFSIFPGASKINGSEACLNVYLTGSLIVCLKRANRKRGE